MSRQRTALIAAAFAYAQSFVGIATSFFITRYLVRTLGNDIYGMWLASGALLAYAALADFGIFGVMPWLIAEADGARDLTKTRILLSHGLVVGALAGLLYLLIAVALWLAFPSLLHLSVVDRAVLVGPIAFMTLATAIGFPLRLFAALRAGLQDVKFTGAWAVGQTVLGALLIVVCSRVGLGLYAVAIGTALPPVVAGVASLVRTWTRDRVMLREWPTFRWSDAQPIFVGGVGGWFGNLGWQLAFATDAVVIASIGHRELVPMFVVTSRLGLTLMQFAWALPDSASIGLAQLNAEGSRERVTATVSALIRMHLLLAGGVVCAILAVNVGLVRVWVGADLYGGTRLNGFFAADIVALSIAHALCVPAAVLGRRVGVGIITLGNGVVHILLALVLGTKFGLSGVAAATFLSALFTTIPLAPRFLRDATSLRSGALLRLGALWSTRALPCVALAAFVGWFCDKDELVARLGSRAPLGLGSLASIVVVVLYVYAMRPIMRDLPFGPRLHRILSAFRLV